MRITSNRDGVLLQYDDRVGSNQRLFERLEISEGEGVGVERTLQFQVGEGDDPVMLTGLTLNKARDKLLYLALTFKQGDGAYGIHWMLEGDNASSSIQVDGHPGSISGGALFLCEPPPADGGSAPQATGFELYHLAVYPRALSASLIKERVDLLGLKASEQP